MSTAPQCTQVYKLNFYDVSRNKTEQYRNKTSRKKNWSETHNLNDWHQWAKWKAPFKIDFRIAPVDQKCKRMSFFIQIVTFFCCLLFGCLSCNVFFSLVHAISIACTYRRYFFLVEKLVRVACARVFDL